MEELLRKAIEKYNKENKNNAFLIRPLREYKKQLIPVINNKGEKEVWINCLCDRKDNNWKMKLL